MDKSKLGTREVVQVGIIVKDIEKTGNISNSTTCG